MDLTGINIKNKYRIIEKIDKDDLSNAWIAQNLHDSTSVVINLVKKNLLIRIDDLIRFRNEATIVSKLMNPGIERIFDIGEHDDYHYVVREFVRGDSLQKMIQDGMLFSVAGTVDIVCDICNALMYVHDVNVIHRDLRPKNIIINRINGDNEQRFQIRIINFGLVHITKYNFNQDCLVNDELYYSSPEVSGAIKRTIDERSDIYSLGVLFYQLLTNTLPINGSNASEIIHNHIASVPESIAEKNPDVPEILDKIVFKLLEKEPEKRYQTLQDLLQDLSKFKNGENDFDPGTHFKQIKLNYHTHLIGREEELNTLKLKVDESLIGKGSICLIAGEAGRGKSRLVDELRNFIYEKQGVCISAKCCMDDSKTPYNLLKGAMDSYHNYYSRLSDSEKENVQPKIKAKIGDLGRVILKLNPSMEDIIGEAVPLINLKPEMEKERFYMVISQFFLSLGQVHKSTTIILDDLHWIDEASMEILTALVSDISNQNLLVIGTYRDDEIDESHPIFKFIKNAPLNKYPLTQIQLQAFEINRMIRFVSNLLFDKEENVKEIAEFILKKGSGNPFFSIEILKQLIDEKVIVREAGRWQIFTSKADTLSIPSTIIDIIIKRIDELDDNEKNVLSYAAIIGNKFDINFLLSLVNENYDNVVRIVDKAIDMQLLEQNSFEDGRILFVHDRIKEAFYKYTDDKKLKEIHFKIACMLDGMNKDKDNSSIFEIAQHYLETDNTDKALEYSCLAGKKALDNFANDDAVNYFKKSIKYMDEKGEKGSEQWNFCMRNIGYILAVTGRITDAIDTYNTILAYANNDFNKAQVYNFIGYAYSKIGDIENCQKSFEKSLQYQGYYLKDGKIPVIIDVVKQLSIHIVHNLYRQSFTKEKQVDEKFELFCYSMNVLTWAYAISGVYKMIDVMLMSLNMIEKRRTITRHLSLSEMAYAGVCMVIPLFARAKIFYERALIHAFEIDDQWCVAEIYQYMGHYFNWTGNLTEGISYAEKSAGIFKKIGDIKEFAMSLNPLLQGYYYQSDYDNMGIINTEIQSISYKIKDNYTLCASNIFFMQYYREKGDYENALIHGMEVNKLSFEIKDWFNYCSSCIELGILYVEMNKISKAIEFLERAKELKEKNNFINQYMVLLYQNLAEAYLMEYLNIERKIDKSTRHSYLVKINYNCQRALKETKNWVLHYGGALRVNAGYMLCKGNIKDAEKLYLKSIEHCLKYKRKFEAAKSHYEYGLLLKLSRRIDEAKSSFESAYGIFDKIGSDSYKIKTADYLGISYQENYLTRGVPKEIRNYQRMYSVISLIRNISSILDLNVLLDKILMTAIEISGAQNGYLMLRNEKTGNIETFVKKVTSGSASDVSNQIVQIVNDRGEAVVTNIADGANSVQSSMLINKTKSVLCLPIKSNDEIVGICYLENKLSSAVFEQEDVEILNTVLAQAAISIENAKLYNVATTDGLTGLISHKHFKYSLEKEIERCKRYKKVFSLIMFDVDHFKTINDTYGHQAGDLVLVTVANVLRDTFRSSDIIGRYGGDEIVVILPEIDENATLIAAKRLMDAIRSVKIQYEDKTISLTISAGIAIYDKHLLSCTDMIKAVDNAMYISKKNGRNRFSIHDGTTLS